MVKIQWPRFTLLTLPFQIPLPDTSQLIISLKEKLTKLDLEENIGDPQADRLYYEYEKLLLRLEAEFFKHTDDETPFNKLRIVWSYVKRQHNRGTVRVSKGEEMEFFEDVCEKFFEDRLQLDKLLSEIKDKDVPNVMTFEEVIARFYVKEWR
ncbi:hypothetical protein TrRE_jg3777, partial [Triparma retinervis]